MNLFEIVKYGVSCRDAAERYGVEVNRYSMALCPFHNDRHPSLYVADDHYHCFACGEHGDVIDFVGRLFQLSPYDAARKLMTDFHLSPDKPPSAAALHAKRIRTEAQQLILPFRMLSHRTMKPIGRSCEQGITDGNLSGFAAWQIFHCKAHTVHLLKNQYHEKWR